MNYKLLKQFAHEQETGNDFSYYVQLFDSVKFVPVDDTDKGLDDIEDEYEKPYKIYVANNSDGPNVSFWFVENDILLCPAFATFKSLNSFNFYIIRNVGPNENQELVFTVDCYDSDAINRISDLCSVSRIEYADGTDFAIVGCDPDVTCDISFTTIFEAINSGKSLFDAIEEIVDKKLEDERKGQSPRTRKPGTEK